MNNSLYPFLSGMSEYTKKLKEINKQFAVEVNSKLDGILEAKILAETLNTQSPTIKAISEMVNKPYYYVLAKYNMKKLYYKMLR